MKKIYLISAIAILTFSNCKKKDVLESKTNNDTIVMDSTYMEKPEIDSTIVDSSIISSKNVDLLDTLATKNRKIVTNPAKGKFALAETKWKLVELNGKVVKSSNGKDYFINLDSKSGKFAAYAGCNKISGIYINKSTDKLMFSKIISTRMACSNSNVESEFIQSLGKVDNYMIDAKYLHFHQGKKITIARFEASK